MASSVMEYFRVISIHALREEGDTGSKFYRHPVRISIHALREEGDDVPVIFHRIGRISIHALREEGDNPLRKKTTKNSLFLSTPSARRATYHAVYTNASIKFLSTPSARRATFAAVRAIEQAKISIHALREEGDLSPPRTLDGTVMISIHALREEGDARRFYISVWRCRFLSTPSARRATKGPVMNFKAQVISIHALREEGDL